MGIQITNNSLIQHYKYLSIRPADVKRIFTEQILTCTTEVLISTYCTRSKPLSSYRLLPTTEIPFNAVMYPFRSDQ